ncbi:MAG: Hsp33 family molecular chaperone HslO [Chloroflexota bacterium]
MDDYVIRILAKEAGIRGLVALTTQISEEACERHKVTSDAAITLAEGMTSAALLGALLKMRQRVSIKFEGDGPLGPMVVDSTSHGLVRGYVTHPEANGSTNSGEMLGQSGVLTVAKDLRLKDIYKGVTKRSGTIDHDITEYLNTSEQIPSFVSIGAELNDDGRLAISGGLLVQSLPPYDDSLVNQIKERMYELPPIGAMLKEGKTPEEIAALAFGDIEYRIIEKRWLFFHCQCSRERSEEALMSLGPVELKSLIEEQEEVVIDCHFCHEEYRFSSEDLQGLIAAIES